MIIRSIKQGIRLLANSKEEFSKLTGRTLESVIADYAILLILVSALAGLTSLVYSIVGALYMDLFLDVNIQYIKMINYSFGRSVSLLFFYMFAGTFILFFVSLILKPFLHKIRYISLLKILFYSLTPFLLIGWVLPNPLPLGIWSLFLLIIGTRVYKDDKIKKDSIKKRE